MNQKPKVTICCITYNQEKYIRQTLDGFIAQKTSFPFIVKIGDDCSTDNTKIIIEEYAKKYPDIIKPIYQKENTNIYGNMCAVYSDIETDYVAICEGDDYWIDENKLQKQINFLENNPEYTICFHPVKVIFENNEAPDYIYPKKKSNFTFDKFLYKNFIETNSVVYRWRYKNEKIENYHPENIMPGDWFVHLLHAQTGKIGFINEVMSVYRRQSDGIWYDSFKDVQKLKLKYGIEMINFYKLVWKKLTNKSDEYLNKSLLPALKDVLHTYYSFGNFDKCNEIKKENFDLVEKIIPLDNQDKLKNKYKKYKKLYFIFMNLTIFLSLILLWRIFG